MVVPLSTALSLLTAVLIVSLRSRNLRSFFQATFYLPGVISGLAVAIIWRFVFDYHVGVLNFFLSLLGMEAVNWLGNVYTALPSLAGMTILSGNGVAIIIFCAALLSVPAYANIPNPGTGAYMPPAPGMTVNLGGSPDGSSAQGVWW